MLLLKPILLKIVGYDKASEWYINKGFHSDEAKNVDSSFFTIATGYPACGYIHHKYLFHFDKTSFNIVHSWSKVMDGYAGFYQEFVTEKDFDEKASFYSRSVAIEPLEDESENLELGMIRYSDSIHYFKKNNI